MRAARSAGLLCGCGVALAATIASAGAEPPAQALAISQAENHAMRHATVLAGEIGARLTGTKQLARAERWAAGQFEKFGLDGVRLEKWGEMESRRARGGTVAVHNVIADIRGTEKPDEYVIVGAHLDSHGFADGATDNAAGCAAVIEAAHLIQSLGIKPRRTIRFVLWTGEEQGLLGSSAYVAAHADDLARTSAVFNLDAGTGAVSGLVIPAALRSVLESPLTAVAAATQRPFEIRTTAALSIPEDCCSKTPNPATGTCTGSRASCALPPGESGCPSDHVPFLRAGVPAFMFEQSGSADYARTHHTALDTVDALDAAGIEHSSRAIAIAALGVANLPGLLPRDGVFPATAFAPGAACTPSCSNASPQPEKGGAR